MSKATHNGRRKKREEFAGRIPALGYYIIVTNTKETEKNYIRGLRDSIVPNKLQGKLVIKVSKTDTMSLVDQCKKECIKHPQYAEPWIVFDKDEVTNFDQIIKEAAMEGMYVGWSNPCIEYWLGMYLGGLKDASDSIKCNKKFNALFEKKTGKEYDKSDTKIYSLLNKYGNEKEAIKAAKGRYEQHFREHDNPQPSQMCPCTTLYQLVEEIRGKVNSTK